MAFNNKSNDLSNNCWYMDVQNQKQVYPIEPKSQPEQQQSHPIKRKRCHANRKLQRYRRKLRNQGIDLSVHSKLSSTNENSQHHKQTIINSTIIEATCPPVKSIQQKITKKKKCNQNNSQLDPVEFMGNDLVDYNAISDEMLYQRTLTAFNRSDKFNSYFIGDKKIHFIRRYIHLIAQNIWHGRMSKPSAMKYSICHTYDRSKSVIEQRLKLIEKHLKQAQNAIEKFEQEIITECQQDNDCLNAMKELNSIIYQLVHEKQQVLECNFEYQRKMLIFNAADHQLLQNFFDIRPNNKHIILARHIWQATKNQLTIEEDLALLKYRQTSTALQSTSNSVHEIINNIDQDIQKLNETISIFPTSHSLSNEIDKLIQLKNKIIHQAIVHNEKKLEHLSTIIQAEQYRFSVKNRFMEKNPQWHEQVFDAIETRRKHMIQRAKCIQNHNLVKITQDK
ncbi:unnamed protein product [Adineta ricciae]|uniref:Uncharacterized protein n=1 Tax=Adineta ricciae TaxID=249248 RepID=A0A815QDF5_ADIRI|nr:unnamed protein product [Adineta ricciae]CAF1505888.1 unnamed protein product [Adineta ricciae]